jgi:hypothetical protein
MKTFYVSMAGDLLGVYIAFDAPSRKAVNQYLEREYFRNGQWKLPWCAVYDKLPECHHPHGAPVIVQAQCGSLYEEEEVTDGG